LQTTAFTITARGLLGLVEPYGPTVEYEELVFDLVPPAEHVSVLAVLHTGIRALLTHRQWWGSSAHDATRPRVEMLNIDRPIPLWCGLLSVAGDGCWDRINSAARIDHLELFAPFAAGIRGT
jgi:hypothetical protein